MKKFLLVASVAALSACLAGCGTPLGNYIGNGVNSFEDFVTSPKTQATITILGQQSVVFICDVSAFANLAGQIEVQVGAGVSTIGTNGKVLAASTTACTGLAGIVAGTTTATAGSTVVTSATKVVK